MFPGRWSLPAVKELQILKFPFLSVNLKNFLSMMAKSWGSKFIYWACGFCFIILSHLWIDWLKLALIVFHNTWKKCQIERKTVVQHIIIIHFHLSLHTLKNLSILHNSFQIVLKICSDRPFSQQTFELIVVGKAQELHCQWPTVWQCTIQTYS